MTFCRACGVDVDDSKERKSRRSLSDSTICSLLTGFATSAVKALPTCHGYEFCLDMENFEAGYVCRRCFRELTKLNNLQKQLIDTKEAIATKVAKAAAESLLPLKKTALSANEMRHPLQSQQKKHAKQISANENSRHSAQKRSS